MPRLSYAHYSYPQLAYSPYAGAQQSAAAYSSYYPAYLAGSGGYYPASAAYTTQAASALSGHQAVGYLQAASIPQQVQVAAAGPLAVYSTAGPKVIFCNWVCRKGARK